MKADNANLAILASAGTGKTHQLAVRLARLLMRGHKPQELIALTFTRSAAGEFYVRALMRLRAAATDKEEWLRVCGDAGKDGVDKDDPLVLDPKQFPQEKFAEKLRELVLGSDRLTLSTLDSFFVRVVNQFALELGLETTKPTVVGEQDAQGLSEATLLRMVEMRKAAKSLDDLNQKAISFSKGKYGANPVGTMLEMTKAYQELYTVAKSKELWGNLDLALGSQRPIWYKTKIQDADVAAVRAVLDDYPENTNGKLTYRKQLTDHFEKVIKARTLGDLNSSQLENLQERYLAALEVPENGKHSFEHQGHTTDFNGENLKALKRLAGAILAAELDAASESTKAAYDIVAEFSKLHDDLARRKGQLTFGDYALLLNGWLAPAEDGSPMLPAAEDIQFRLDSQFQHWLLDEFQDTSTPQYEVLDRNIEEIVGQDEGVDRSVFAVGDAKQSLYEWRAGNRELLINLRDNIKSKKGRVRELNETWRCAPEVLKLVNAALGKLTERNLGQYFSPIAANDWDAVFSEQKPVHAPGKPSRVGQALWVRIKRPAKPTEEAGKPQEASKDAEDPETESDEAGTGEELEGSAIERQALWIAEDLRKSGVLAEAAKQGGTSRLRDGISCAILVPRNSQARAIAEVLRKEGIEATDEEKTAVVRDNPVTAGLFAIIEATAHPDNSEAKGLAWMSPSSRQILASAPGRAANWPMVAQGIANLFASRGAEAVVDWLVGSAKDIEPGTFVAKRLEQFRAIAADYDATGGRDLVEFVRYVDTTHLRDLAAQSSVQLITIHRSKGLEYDMVYMPCLNSSHKMAELRGGLLYSTQAMDEKMGDAPASSTASATSRFRPKWILAKLHPRVTPHVPQLIKAENGLKAENAYGSLCRLYVGMTRAKTRLVMLSEELSETKLAVGTDGHFEAPAQHGKHDPAMFMESSLRLDMDGKERKAQPTPYKVPSEYAWSSDADPTNLKWREQFDRKPAKVDQQSGGDHKEPKYLMCAPAVRPGRRKLSESTFRQPAPWAAENNTAGGKHFGTYVHALFAQLGCDADGFLSKLQSMRPPEGMSEVHQAALNSIKACLGDTAIRSLLVGDLEGKVLWVERKAAVQLIEAGEPVHIPAVFDRVHIVPGKSALIIDYKTASKNHTAEYLQEHYLSQMTGYRDAVARLTGISEDNIHAKLIGILPAGPKIIDVL